MTAEGEMDGALAAAEEVAELLEQTIEALAILERALPYDSQDREYVRQVRAQLEITRSDDHSWLGGSRFTVAGIMSRLSDEVQDY